MTTPSVKLMQHTSLDVCAHAIRTCWQSFDNSDNGGEKDKNLIDRVGNKFKHASTLEHLVYTFYISNVSRALLQELARHRIASPSVKSTRYTLKEVKDSESFEKPYTSFKTMILDNGDRVKNKTFDIEKARANADKFLVWTGDDDVDRYSIYALENLRKVMNRQADAEKNILAAPGNDKLKFCLPESFKTELTWTINARALQNFIYLRSSKSALWEIRNLANVLFESLPKDHQYLFNEYIEKNDDE